MISVIVPVYKVEKYLRQCVESIQAQTYKDLEIILVDDGSPDKCPNICDELAKKDGRIKVVHKENGGQSTARNQGLSYATGEFIGFVDSDDTIEPNMYQTLYQLINCYQVDIAMCGCNTIDERSTMLATTKDIGQPLLLNQNELWHEVFAELNNAVWNKLFKASLLKDIRFPEDIIHGEDLLFNIEYLKLCNTGVITSEPLYNYLKREGSVTKQAFSSKKLFEITSKDMARDIIKEWHPELVPVANLFAFRARMNVLRSIYKANAQTEYAVNVSACEQYAYENYNSVKSLVRIKETIEYSIYRYLKPLYKILTKNSIWI